MCIRDSRYDVNQFNYEQDTFHEISASEYSDRSHSHDYNVGMNYAINKNQDVYKRQVLEKNLDQVDGEETVSNVPQNDYVRGAEAFMNI